MTNGKGTRGIFAMGTVVLWHCLFNMPILWVHSTISPARECKEMIEPLPALISVSKFQGKGGRGPLKVDAFQRSLRVK